MTADVPRRLPRTQGQRVQNVARTHAAPSLGGSTAAARPVQNTTPNATTYRAPVAGVLVGRVGSDGSGTSITSTGSGAGSSNADGGGSVSIGQSSGPAGPQSVNVGAVSYAPGLNAVAAGYNSKALADYTVAVGPYTTANAARAVAIGYGAQATEADDIMLGSAGNHVKVPGALILTDGAGGLHRLVVGTDGALSTVAYP